MIQKLRLKLVAASMLSLFLVLAVIMGAVNIVNYREIVTEADSTLSILSENNGSFPRREELARPNPPADGGEPPLSPELPYESRYFSVLFSGGGDVLSTDTGKIAAVDDEAAAEFARQVWESGKNRGFLHTYRYVRKDEANGVRIIFLDCGRDISTFRTFLAASCGISALGLLAVFVLIFLLSRRIFRPVLESYEKQKRFITDAGHEIKTPLTIIHADAEVLELELGENEWLSDIRKQALRLTDLTNSLILLSRMEEDRPKLTAIEFPFSDLVSETAQSFQALAKTQKKKLTVSIAPLLSLCGDEKALRQLLSILLDNALKYSGEDGDILLSLERRKKVLCLSVENSVDGSLPKDTECLFERFYRADQSRSPQKAGYGLGLPIARAIAAAHGGKIAISTKEPGRLLVQVFLPASAP